MSLCSLLNLSENIRKLSFSIVVREGKKRSHRGNGFKRTCRTANPSLAASLETLTHRRNVASLSLFYRYDFVRCSSELPQLALLPYSRGRSTHYSDRLYDFSVTIPRCYKDVYIYSLPIKCFPLTYFLKCFKSRIKRQLLTVGSF